MEKLQTVLITGPTSGIGHEFAKLFAKGGARLILVGRGVKELQDIQNECIGLGASSGTLFIEADLSQQDVAQHIVEKLTKEKVNIDVLVNNAGFGLIGEFLKTDGAKEMDMIQVNIATVTALTKLLIPGMVERGYGKILNLASTAAFQPGPLMAVYYATKAYVLSFSSAVGYELRGTGVTVTVLCPGPTKTHFDQQAGMTHTSLFRRPMDPSEVAQAGYDGLMAGMPTVIPGFHNWYGTWLARIVPREWALRRVWQLHQTEIPKSPR